MGRILAIDYGLKRCGVAVTDNLRLIASPLEAVATHTLLVFLMSYCLKNEVDIIVLGKPTDMAGKASETEKHIVPFINQLRKAMPDMILDRWDERFTSKMALQAMIDAGSKKSDRRVKGNIDKVSAAIILQDYLNFKKR